MYTYSTPGIYTVVLDVSGFGGSDTNTKADYITVYDPVSADFSVSDNDGIAPLAVSFTDLFVGDMDTWSWDFDNDGTEDSAVQNPTYTYNTPGTYTVTLSVSGPGGSDAITKTDYIDVYQFHWPNRGSYHFRQHWDYDPSGMDRAAIEADIDQGMAMLADQARHPQHTPSQQARST